MMSLGEMAACLGNAPENFLPEAAKSLAPKTVVTDSRLAGPGALFICMRGKQADGHDFAPQAAADGALALLAERDPFPGIRPPVPVLRAPEAAAALQKLGARQRELFTGKALGVTGSAGKTTVKEVLASVLSRRGLTSRNHLNLNNGLGLPLSLLNADMAAQFWVMEAGISEKGDMDELGAILRPDLALILNIGQAHLSGLGGADGLGVAHYKSLLLRYLRPGGLALVSADYPELLRASRSLRRDALSFSALGEDSPEYYCHAAYVGPAPGRPDAGLYKLRLEGLRLETPAPFKGAYGAENVAAIAGAARLLGLEVEEIKAGLVEAELPEQRFHCRRRGAFTLIDDSYNSNPLSAARMIQAAAGMAGECDGPLFLVLGEMLELGTASAAAHSALGMEAARSGAEALLWRGGQGEAVREGLESGGFQGMFKILRETRDFSTCLPWLRERCLGKEGGAARGVILFKGSRANRLESLAEEFQADFFAALEA